MNVEWKKVNPAELSVTCCADYYAFSDRGRCLFVGELDQKCTFTKIIQASVNLGLSIYQMDIWVGSVLNSHQASAIDSQLLEARFRSFLIKSNTTATVKEPALVWEYCA
jgi:hypothetical protein